MSQSSTQCRWCKRLLTDPVSIAKGIGPECEGQEADWLELIAPFSVGARVQMTGGEGKGGFGTVFSVVPFRRGKPSPRPIHVSYERFGGGFYRPDQLQLVEGGAA